MVVTWHEITKTHGVAAVGNTLILALLAPVPPAVVGDVRRHLGQLAKAHPAGLGYVHVIDGDDPAPQSDETRAAFRELLTKMAATKLRVALIAIARTGFGGAVARLGVSSLLIAARVATPIKVTRSVGEGSAWFSDTLQRAAGFAPPSGEVEHVVAELLDRIRAAR